MIFSEPCNVLCIVDGDVYHNLIKRYQGPTKIEQSPVSDIEVYIYRHRHTLLSGIADPLGERATKIKDAAKSYWKHLMKQDGINENLLYGFVCRENPDDSAQLVETIKTFLTRD